MNDDPLARIAHLERCLAESRDDLERSLAREAVLERERTAAIDMLQEQRATIRILTDELAAQRIIGRGG